MTHSFPSPYSTVQSILFQNWAGFCFCCFLAKTNQALLVKPLVFTFMNASPDCRLWQWYSYLTVLDLSRCCEGERILRSSTLIFLCSLPGTFFNECTALFIWPLIKVSAICLLGYLCLLNLHRHLFGPHIENSTQQLPNANSTFGINSRPFMCWICQIKRGKGHTWSSDWLSVNCPITLSLWKWRIYMYKNGWYSLTDKVISLLNPLSNLDGRG